MTDAVWSLPITALAERLRAGRLHPVDLLDAYLDRIAAQDDQLAAFVHVNAQARTAAEDAGREIAEGGWRGTLHGVPIAVKDNYLTMDMPTTAGTTAPGLDAPMRDATADAQPARPRARSRRIERRVGRRRRRRALRRRARLRYRRVDPYSRQPLRLRRTQADFRSDRPGRHRAAQLVARPRRPARGVR